MLRYAACLLTLCVAGCLLLSPAPAEAAKGKKKNGSDAKLKAMFKKLDTDNDGRLTKAEFAKLKAAKGNKAGKAGKTSKKKSGKKSGGMFAKLDANHDGYLTFDEFKAVHHKKNKKKK